MRHRGATPKPLFLTYNTDLLITLYQNVDASARSLGPSPDLGDNRELSGHQTVARLHPISIPTPTIIFLSFSPSESRHFPSLHLILCPPLAVSKTFVQLNRRVFRPISSCPCVVPLPTSASGIQVVTLFALRCLARALLSHFLEQKTSVHLSFTSSSIHSSFVQRFLLLDGVDRSSLACW